MFLFVLIALVACDVSKCLENDDMVELFSNFVTKFEKMYANEFETSKRYLIFCENVNYIMDMKKQAAETDEWDADWMGVTEFTDLSPEEFRAGYLSKGYTPEEMRRGEMTDYEFGSVGDVPDSWDWNDHGAVTPVKNQGACGSCWSFSSTGNMEGQWFLGKGDLLSFSEQQIVDCDNTSYGCQGGLMDNAFEYIIEAGGAESESEYPYKGVNENCGFDKSKIVASFTSYKDLPEDETQLMEWCYANGPIAVAMDAILLQFYFGGIFNPPKLLCPAKELDHGVLIVGYGTESGIIKKDKRGDGKCGINTSCSSIKV